MHTCLLMTKRDTLAVDVADWPAYTLRADEDNGDATTRISAAPNRLHSTNTKYAGMRVYEPETCAHTCAMEELSSENPPNM